MSPIVDPLDELEARLEYRFQDRNLLVRAMVHRSYSYEHRAAEIKDNQTLEFLGDAVLDMISADILFKQLPHAGEGELTQRRARLVNTASLGYIAKDLGLPGFLKLGKGEIKSGGREKLSIIGAALEALIGALYLDGGLEIVRKHVKLWLEKGNMMAQGSPIIAEAKGRLQEIAHSRRLSEPTYKLIDQSGPDHRREFRVAVIFGGRELAQGIGKSKKSAEAAAARMALTLLEDEE